MKKELKKTATFEADFNIGDRVFVKNVEKFGEITGVYFSEHVGKSDNSPDIYYDVVLNKGGKLLYLKEIAASFIQETKDNLF